MPITYLYYNKDGYTSHCKDYREYQEWLLKRNQVRFTDNEGKKYDGKNMMHTLRLIRMAKEIASGEGVKLDRSAIDKEQLLNVRQHYYEYDEIMSIIDEERELAEKALNNSTLPEHINTDKINDILIAARKIAYKY